MNKKPPELHLVEGTKSRRIDAAPLPEQIKSRIPEAEWMHNPHAWDKSVFIKETADFLYDVYGIGCDQDKHTLAMLASHIETFIECENAIQKRGLISKFNDGKTIGPNPYLTIRNKTTTLIIQLMNELGLNPRNRLSSGKVEENSAVAKFLKGPFAS